MTPPRSAPEDDPARALALLDDAGADRLMRRHRAFGLALRWAFLAWSAGFFAALATGLAKPLQGVWALLALFGGPCGAIALLFAQGAEAEEALRLQRVSDMDEGFQTLAKLVSGASKQSRAWRDEAARRGRSLRLFDLRMMQTLSADEEGPA